MASSKTKRKGKILGRHSAKVAGNIADKACNEASFVNGGCGVSVSTSPDLEASHKMELMIGDMTISIDADLPSPSFGTSHIYNKPSASEAQDYESPAGEVECRPSFTQLDEDLDLRHNSAEASTSGCSSCPLCAKDLVTEISRLGDTCETETCKHLFCKECFGNLVKGFLLRLSLKSATLEDVTSALQCPFPKCEQHFTYRDIQHAVGSTALQQFQSVLVSLFSRNFGSSWEKVCAQCSTRGVQVSLISATDLEYLSLAEVYRAMEARGLPVSGRSKEQGLRDLETVTSALVASPWRLVCLTCDFVQCETCGLQVQGPRSSSLVKHFSPDGTIEDFGIILQGREISPYPNTLMPDPILDREREPPFLGTSTTSDITHKECDTCRKQCFSVYCAAMEINACSQGCMRVSNSLQELSEKFTSKSRADIKEEAAIWPVDGSMVNTPNEPGGSILDLSQKPQAVQGVPCSSYQPLNLATSNGVSEPLMAGTEDSLSSNASAANMLKLLLPTGKKFCSSQEEPLEREFKSSILESPAQKPGFGAHRELMMTPTTENLQFNSPFKDPHVLMNNRSMLKEGVNSKKYWSSKAATWMRSSDYWCQESERFALASDWWLKEGSKWAGKSAEMAHKANTWANLAAHWTQSAECVMAANKLWGYKIQEMSELCTSVLQTGTDGAFYSELGPKLERVGSFSTNSSQLQIPNLRTRSDGDEYSDCMGAETEWISPVEGNNQCWSTASNASVPLTSLNSSPTTSDSPIHSKEPTCTRAGLFVESKVTGVGKTADEKLINSFRDLTNILEVIEALGTNLSAPAAYFLWGFEPLQEILLSLLGNNSLRDIMTRDSLYSEAFRLLRTISSHRNILPILFMPISRLNSETTPQNGNKGSVFEAFEKLHWQAEDMLSEVLVTVDNDHDATQKNQNLIGDMEDAYDFVQRNLESLWKPGQALPS